MIAFKPGCNDDIAAFFFNVDTIRDELATRLDDAFRASPTTSVWFLPGAQPEDHVQAQAPANWPVHGHTNFNRFVDGIDETAINIARTMVWHAPTVGTYSVWMIPGVKHAEFERPE